MVNCGDRNAAKRYPPHDNLTPGHAGAISRNARDGGRIEASPVAGEDEHRRTNEAPDAPVDADQGR
jgi:hypothetical protein